MDLTLHDELPVALTIAGSDSGAGAGIQADLLTFAALGVYGTTAVTCLTAQNPDGVSAVQAMPPDFVREQIDQVTGFYKVAALKTGMLFDSDIIEAVCRFLDVNRQIKVVVDPVMVATSGATLLKKDAIERISKRLLPLATVITPNLDEAAVLLGQRPESVHDMRDAARTLQERHHCAVLLKGGHLESGEEVHDILCDASGSITGLRHERIDGVNTHGSGCTLSAAIAAFLAKGLPLAESVEAGRDYLVKGLRNPLKAGGQQFIAHL